MLRFIRRLLRFAHISFASLITICLILFGISFWMFKHANWYEKFRLSPDERWLLASTGSHVRLYDLKNHDEEARNLSFHHYAEWDYYFESMAFFDAHRLVMLTIDKSGGHRIVLWDVENDSQVDSFPIDELPASFQCAVSGDGRTMFIFAASPADKESILLVWDLTQRRELQRVRLAYEIFDELSISHDGGIVGIQSAYPDRQIYFYRVKDWHLLSTRPRHSVAFALSPDGKKGLEFTRTKACEFDVATGSIEAPLFDFKSFLVYGYSSDGSRLLVSDGKDQIVWDTLAKSEIARRPAEAGAKISLTGHHVILWRDQHLSVWNVDTGDERVLSRPANLPDPCSMVCVLLLLAMSWMIVMFVHMVVGRSTNHTTIEVDVPIRAELADAIPRFDADGAPPSAPVQPPS